MEIQKSSIRDSPNLVHYEIRRKMGRDEEKRGQGQKRGHKRGSFQERAVWQL